MTDTIKGSIAIYDFSHGIHVAFNAAGAGEAGLIVMDQLAALKSSCDHVIVAIDSKPYRRSKLYEGYKAGRKTDPELSSIWERTMQRVRDGGFQVASAPGEEADDVMATLALEYTVGIDGKTHGFGCTDVRLVTADKDISQCINKHVRWFYPQLGKRDEFEIRDESWMLAHWGDQDWKNRAKDPKVGPNPAQIPLVLAIMGDQSDKIPGVSGIGVVQAVGLIHAFKTSEGITNAALSAIEAAKVTGKKPPALWENWLKGMAEVPKWLSLTTLNTEAQLDKHPLKYLEKLEPKAVTRPEPVVQIGEDDIVEPDWDAIEAKYQAEEREAIMKENDKNRVWERDPAVVAADNAKEAPRVRPDGRTQAKALEDAKLPAIDAPLGTWPALDKLVVEAEGNKNPHGLSMLRAPFPDNQISQLPKGTKEQNACPPSEKRSCSVCGGWHHPKIRHLSYVGHAALTDRLLDADTGWSWEPMALTPEGLPLFDKSGGLWIRLTVCGVTRLGYGHAEAKQNQDAGAREKEVIGDALRNAGMRFGCALYLWHKGELHAHREDE